MQRLKFLYFIPFLLLTVFAATAQETDYLKHGKIFKICSIKAECSDCYSCYRERFLLHVQNNSDKRIKTIYYKYHSFLYNRDIRSEAKLEVPIDKHQSGIVHVCVNDKLHWRISGIVYEDGSTASFSLADPLATFVQEADEDCN